MNAIISLTHSGLWRSIMVLWSPNIISMYFIA
jgi:hypothetical protein